MAIVPSLVGYYEYDAERVQRERHVMAIAEEEKTYQQIRKDNPNRPVRIEQKTLLMKEREPISVHSPVKSRVTYRNKVTRNTGDTFGKYRQASFPEGYRYGNGAKVFRRSHYHWDGRYDIR